MKYPLTKDRSVLDAAEFWWKRCLSRIVKTRPIAKPDEQRRIARLLELEKKLARQVLAA